MFNIGELIDLTHVQTSHRCILREGNNNLVPWTKHAAIAGIPKSDLDKSWFTVDNFLQRWPHLSIMGELTANKEIIVMSDGPKSPVSGEDNCHEASK